MAKVHAKYWTAVMYLENLIDDWQSFIDQKVQVPFAYCIHDQDLDKAGQLRKAHVHVIIAFPNTTTEKTALSAFKTLEKDGCSAIPNDVIQQVFSIRNAYDYLIHDTEDCRKKKKHEYSPSERITGNGFEIGNFEQISLADKREMIDEMATIIIEQKFTNFLDFYKYVKENCDPECRQVVQTSSGFFERLTKGNYQKYYNSSDKRV